MKGAESKSQAFSLFQLSKNLAQNTLPFKYSIYSIVQINFIFNQVFYLLRQKEREKSPSANDRKRRLWI